MKIAKYACGSMDHIVNRRRFLSGVAGSVATTGTVVSVYGGSMGGILLFFNATLEKEVHRTMLTNIARDMDLHAATGLVASAHHDSHLRISGLFA